MNLNQTKASRGLGALIGWCLLLCATMPFSEAAADIFHIDSIRVNAPQIHNDSIIYTLDIYFFEKPPKFFSYYDNDSGVVNIEFMDAQIVVSPIKIPKGVPFLGLKAKSMESGMAITKQETRVLLLVDKGEKKDQLWNCDASLGQKNSLRVTIWKEKKHANKIAQRKIRVIAVVSGVSLVIVLAAAAVFFFMPSIYK